jgi:hypothetical protein
MSKKDAFDALEEQERLVGDLIDGWKDTTERLSDRDGVDLRWQRGSDVKLLLQHVAVREEAIEEVGVRLRQLGQTQLASLLEGNTPARRQAIDRLDRSVRGHQAINANNAEATAAVEDLAAIVGSEVGAGRNGLLFRAAEALGPTGGRDLRSARYTRTHSVTVPSPSPRWFDRVGPLKAARAVYDNLRSAPTGGTKPSVDEAREHKPGLRD